MWWANLRVRMAKRRVSAIEQRIVSTADELEYWHYALARAKRHASEEALRCATVRAIGRVRHQ